MTNTDTTTWAEREMIEGYFDGYDPLSPEPSDNRSRSYRHGFQNGRDDKRRSPRASAQMLREMAEECIAADMAVVIYG